MVDFTNPVWETPILPPVPGTVRGAAASLALADRKKRDWKLLRTPIEDVPSPFSEKQDYDFDAVPEAQWESITVPGELAMQGIDVQNNREYYYRRTVRLPRTMPKGRVFLRFYGVYSNARVWANGVFLRSHVGGFSAWDCEVTEFAKAGAFRLVVGVADIEGSNQGIWNPDGQKVSDGAWASYYAHHNIGGILRGVTLFVLPESALVRMHLNAEPGLALQNGTLTAELLADADAEDLEVQMELLAGDRCVGAVREAFPLDEVQTGCARHALDVTRAVRFCEYEKNDRKFQSRYLPPKPYRFQGTPRGLRVSLSVQNPLLWDAEHPNLYRVRLTLFRNGETTETVESDVGFRKITYGGADGTAKTKVYVNGRAVKLRGVCRHDVSGRYGRSMDEAELRREILAYKNCNVNFIRTSHYPADDCLLRLCDEYGLYVEQENSACFKGANGMGIYSPPEDFLNSFAEMVETARNHPSVLIWSLANESGFERTCAFRREYEYIKVADPSRPVIFSYPFTIKTKPVPYDIFSKHYAKAAGELGGRDCPVLHDEFAHVACYNLDSLRTGDACRAFWGESIRKGWDSILKTDGALGCAIWAAVDDVFRLPEGVLERHQHHATGTAAGYGEWGCILDAFGREKPEAYLTKKAFSPLRVSNLLRDGENVQLQAENRFDHTNLSEGTVCALSASGETLGEYPLTADIKPHETGVLYLPQVPGIADRLEFRFGGFPVETCALPTKTEHAAEEAQGREIPLCARAVGATLVLQSAAGTARLRFFSGKYAGHEAKVRVLQADAKGVTALLHAEHGKAYCLHLRNASGTVEASVIPASPAACFGTLRAELMLPAPPARITRKKQALYGVYPLSHIDRPIGEARRLPAHAVPERYEKAPAWDWAQDTANFFLYKAGEPHNRTATRDFRCRRDRIEWFAAQMENGYALQASAKQSRFGAGVTCEKAGDRLCLVHGWGYPDLQWGNYTGDAHPFLRQPRFAFCLRLYADSVHK